MASFKDKNGRTWTIALDAPTIRRIRTDFDGLYLLGEDGKAYDRLYDDPLLLCDVLWALARKEAEAAGVAPEQFFAAVAGDPLDDALAAILEAVKDFFPSRRRELLETVAAKNAKIRELGYATAMQKIDDPALERRAVEAMERQMDEALSRILTPSSNATGSPDSSASAPPA